MGITELKDGYSIIYESGKTKNGFFHKSELMKNGILTGIKNKINYINRTWEAYPFQTVKLGLIEKALIVKEISSELAENFKSIVSK